MKFLLTVGLLAVFALAACESDEPPVRPMRQRPAAKYPQPAQAGQYPPQPQPFPQDGMQSSASPASAPEASQETASAPAPAAPQAVKGDFPYGVPVPGKPGFVRSPFSPDKMTDVRGYAPGTEVKDPYHPDKTFLVP